MTIEQESLLSQLNKYWQCFHCRIIEDPQLAKDLEDSGMGWGVGIPCPKCGNTTSKNKFPNQRFQPLFEMMIESSSRPILVLMLAQTAFEGLLDDFVIRLTRRRQCPDDVEVAITGILTNLHSRKQFIKYLTGNTLKQMVQQVGFPEILGQLDLISKKRNLFLHSAYHSELSSDDVRMALKFAADTVDFFAGLFSKYGDWVNPN